ncbi:IS21 family transposase, partial [Amaricoccus sp. HAR-UPW-R2A-40]
DREMVDVLALVLQHDEESVLCAVDMALTAGVPTKMHVLNLLHRLTCGNAPDLPEIDLPKALALVEEPQANVYRYDGLRSRTQGARDAS